MEGPLNLLQGQDPAPFAQPAKSGRRYHHHVVDVGARVVLAETERLPDQSLKAVPGHGPAARTAYRYAEPGLRTLAFGPVQHQQPVRVPTPAAQNGLDLAVRDQSLCS